MQRSDNVPRLPTRDDSTSSTSTTFSSASSRESSGDEGTVFRTESGARFASANRVTIDDLQDLLQSKRGLRVTQIVPCDDGLFTSATIDAFSKSILIRLMPGNFSFMKFARKVSGYPARKGEWVGQRKINADEFIANNYSRETIIEWTLEEMQVQRSLCHHPKATTAMDYAILTNKKGKKQIYQFVPIAVLGDLLNVKLTVIDYCDLRYKPAALKDLSIKLLETVYQLHEFGLVHRDIKPENVLVDLAEDNGCQTFSLTLTDFASSKVFGQNGLIVAAKGDSDKAFQAPLKAFSASLTEKEAGTIHDEWALAITILSLYYGKESILGYVFRPTLRAYYNAIKNKTAPYEFSNEEILNLNKQIIHFLNKDKLLPLWLNVIVRELLYIAPPEQRKGLARIMDEHSFDISLTDKENSAVNKIINKELETRDKENKEFCDKLRAGINPYKDEELDDPIRQECRGVYSSYGDTDQPTTNPSVTTTTPNAPASNSAASASSSASNQETDASHSNNTRVSPAKRLLNLFKPKITDGTHPASSSTTPSHDYQVRDRSAPK